MIQRFPLRAAAAAVLLISACGGNKPSAAMPEPAPSAEKAVQEFMQAVADSNLAKMAQLWGSAKGPAAQTHEPANYAQRIVVMQVYLRNATYRILSNDIDPSQAGRHTLQVEIRRDACQKVVPFGVVQSPAGWLVNQLDLSALGSPGRPCDTPGQ
ncbi:MAG: hypothetical protein H0U85_08240 [Gemmatimonadales bacterium]|nr:hypothetical protein [Gemmatimonadales bacterium]